MHSWVRYSVAVYVGLLMAGAAVLPPDVELERAASAKPEVRQGKIYQPQTGLWYDLLPLSAEETSPQAKTPSYLVAEDAPASTQTSH